MGMGYIKGGDRHCCCRCCFDDERARLFFVVFVVNCCGFVLVVNPSVFVGAVVIMNGGLVRGFFVLFLVCLLVCCKCCMYRMVEILLF